MIRAKFEVGFLTLDCEGKTPSKVFLEIGKTQDLYCLVNQAAMFGEAKKGKTLLDKYIEPAREGTLTMEALRKLNISFGPGAIRCLRIEESDD